MNRREGIKLGCEFSKGWMLFFAISWLPVILHDGRMNVGQQAGIRWNMAAEPCSFAQTVSFHELYGIMESISNKCYIKEDQEYRVHSPWGR